MTPSIPGLEVLFIAGFGPIPQNVADSQAFYQHTLGLPLKPMEGASDYLVADHDALNGAKHFALWPLHHAAASCFGAEKWPDSHPIPQSWVEFEVQDLAIATDVLINKGYQLLVANRLEPWGQSVTRLLAPEGVLVGLTITPWLR
ncbi:glyoxalase [Kosakonia sacchari]|uniref:glyoxalase n=1 Tax=Kosakonia sacchari TaxID=1158459 RepID=UPI0025B194A2|nr:glyoxalase [Kosakonia sacchari]MDN2488315.1 glyoxalase [Kosakonia sacchari]